MQVLLFKNVTSYNVIMTHSQSFTSQNNWITHLELIPITLSRAWTTRYNRSDTRTHTQNVEFALKSFRYFRECGHRRMYSTDVIFSVKKTRSLARFATSLAECRWSVWAKSQPTATASQAHTPTHTHLRRCVLNRQCSIHIILVNSVVNGKWFVCLAS